MLSFHGFDLWLKTGRCLQSSYDSWKSSTWCKETSPWRPWGGTQGTIARRPGFTPSRHAAVSPYSSLGCLRRRRSRSSAAVTLWVESLRFPGARMPLHARTTGGKRPECPRQAFVFGDQASLKRNYKTLGRLVHPLAAVLYHVRDLWFENSASGSAWMLTSTSKSQRALSSPPSRLNLLSGWGRGLSGRSL